MKFGRIISLVLTVVISALFIAGCSSGSENAGVNTDTGKNDSSSQASTDNEAKVPEIKDASEADVKDPAVSDTNDAESEKSSVPVEYSGELSFKSDTKDGVSEDGFKYIISKGGDYRVRGNCSNRMIYIDAKGEEVELHLEGVTMTSEYGALIFVNNAEEVTVSASEGSSNELSDNRPARSDKKEETEYGNAAVYSKDDLKFKGRGRLTINGSYNNGIGCKNDIKIKNINLTVNARNNGIKGNDSVTVESGNITINAENGNGIKTENTHVSDKGNQKGYVTILGGVINITSADDPIDAAYDLILDSKNATVNTNK